MDENIHDENLEELPEFSEIIVSDNVELIEELTILNDSIDLTNFSLFVLIGLLIGYIFIKGLFDNWKA